MTKPDEVKGTNPKTAFPPKTDKLDETIKQKEPEKNPTTHSGRTPEHSKDSAQRNS